MWTECAVDVDRMKKIDELFVYKYFGENPKNIKYSWFYSENASIGGKVND